MRYLRIYSKGKEDADVERQEIWKNIWDNKYNESSKATHLHVLGGYDGLSYKQWCTLTRVFIEQIGVAENHDVLEVGCGPGAFLEQLPPVRSLSGIDYSAGAIEIARSELHGDFEVSEANNVPFVSEKFDLVLSFGVFFYFSSVSYAESVLTEMFRVVKPGGKIFVGEISDIAKKSIAMDVRSSSEAVRIDKHVSKEINADHLYYSKSFFKSIAEKYDAECRIIDHAVPELEFYYNSAYRFSVLFEKCKDK